MQEKIKYFFFALVLLLLFIPWLQKTFEFSPDYPLTGVQKGQPYPEWSSAGWLEGTWQEGAEKYFNSRAGFRPVLMRLSNQIQYSVYGKAAANAIRIGKNLYLYGGLEIEEYTGKRICRKDKMQDLVHKMKFIQDTLEKTGVHFVFCVAPPKSVAYPEFLPERVKPSAVTNYSQFIELAQAEGLQLIDFTPWYISMKDTSQYPLFSRGGMHWSVLGQTYVTDSLTHYVENLENVKLPRILIDSIYWSPKPLHNDNDIAEGMNLLFPINIDSLAYPAFRFSDEAPKLKVLTFGDSFYGYINGNYTNYIFDENEYCFYFGDLFRAGKETVQLKDVDILELVEAKDVVMVFVSHFNIEVYLIGLAERLYPAYAEKEGYIKRIQKYEEMIRKDPNWLETVKAKAEKEGIPLDTALRRDAEYLIQQLRNQE